MSAIVDVLAFAAEVAVYVAVGRWAWKRRGPRALRVAAAVAAVALMALVWGTFAAPTAAHPLHDTARAILEICWFGAGVLAAARGLRRAPG